MTEVNRTGPDTAGYYRPTYTTQQSPVREFTGEPIELTETYVVDEDDSARGLGPITIGIDPSVRPLTNEEIATQFHYTYEALAPSFGWETQKASRTAWEDLPETNKQLMIATISALLSRGVIKK